MKKVKNAKDFKVFRTENGAGFGLKTLVPFKKGDFVIEYIGKKITTKEADDHQGKYLFEIDDDYTIDGSPRWNIARYINHSCRPNCETEIDEDDKINIMAIKKIEPGEELTYDYGKEYFKEFIEPYGCLCEKCSEKKNGKQRTAKSKRK